MKEISARLVYMVEASSKVDSCAIDFQTESLLALNKKLKFPSHFQFLFCAKFECQITFGLEVKYTWSCPITPWK